MSRLSRLACALGLVAALVAGTSAPARAASVVTDVNSLGDYVLAQIAELDAQANPPELAPQASPTTFYAYLTDTDSDEQYDRVTFTSDANAVRGLKQRSTVTLKNDADYTPKNAGADYFEYSSATVFGENVRPGWLAYRSTLTSAVFDASFKDVSLVSMHSWFRGCTRLANIQNLNYVDATQVMYIDWAFSQINVREMDMSSWQTNSLHSMGATFQNSTALQRLDISGWNLNGVMSLQQTFFGCTSLADLNMTGVVANNLKYVHYAFDSCRSLPYIDISGLNLSTVTNAQSMFGSNANLKTIVCAPGAQMPSSANMSGMFSGCSSLVGRCYGPSGAVRQSPLSSLGKVDGTYARACSSSADGYFTPLNEYASYTVVFHSNIDGQDATSTVPVPIYDVTQKYPSMAKSLWARPGYAPVAWNTAPDGGGTTYGLGEAVAAATQPAAGTTLNLYMQWRASTYDLVYDANGGSGSIAGQESLPCAAGAVLSDGSGFARAGYALSGWALTPTGDVAYGLGTTTTSGLSSMDGDTVVLYAKWTANSGTITYDANTAHGGTAYTSAPTGYTRVGGNLTAPAATGDPLALPSGPAPASGYYFSGWYTEPVGGSRVTAGDPVAYDAGMTLYAQFGEDVTYYAICSDTDGDGKKDKLTFTTDSTLATGLGSAATNGNGSPTSIGGTYPDYFYYKASKQFYTSGENKPGWTIYRDTLKKVEVDQSFKSVQLLHMHSYFYNLYAVDEYINLNYIDTSRAQDMDWIFAYSNAETIDLSQWNVEAVGSLGASFRDSAGVKTIDLTGWNFANCTSFQVCFDGCTNLSTLRMTGATSTRSANFNQMFGNCKNLAYLDMTGFTFDKVPTANRLVDMFKGCSALKTILVSPGTSMPSSLSTTSIFDGCNALSGKYIYADGTARETKLSQVASSDSSNYRNALYGRCQTAVTNGYLTPATINNTYTIRYHMNDGGADVHQDVATPTKSSGVTSAYPELAGALWSRTGFAALSWNTAANGSGTKVDLGSQMPADLEPAAGTTLDLYLQWQESTFRIAYDANGGLGSVAAQENVAYTTGTSLSDGAGFSRMGYTLSGWGLTPTAASAAYDKGASVSGQSFKAADGETVTLYAVWMPNSYRVTFDATSNATFPGAGYSGAQSGFDYADGKLSATMSTGSSYRLPADPPVPADTTTYVNPKSSGGTATVADYAFTGWYTKPEGGARVLASDIVALSEDTTLYAQYAHKQQFWALQSDDDGDGTLEHMTFMGTEPVGYDGKLWTDYSTNTLPPAWDADTNATTGTKAITKVTFDPSFTTIKVMSIRDWFCDFQNMTEIENIEYFDASCVLYMEAPFARCYSLKSLDLSSWNTPCVTSILNFLVMSGNTALESVNMSGWDMRQVTTMQNAFKGCKNLTNLDLSGAKTSPNLKNTSEAFESCAKLTQVDLSGFDWSGLTDTHGMFANDPALRTIYSSMTADATGSTLSSSDYMFWKSPLLKGCYYSANSLVGSTSYDETKHNKTLARAQLYNTQSGYLTPVSSYNSATVNYHYNAPDGSDVTSTVMVIPKKISGSYGSSAPALWTYNGYKPVSWNTAADGSGTACPLSATFDATTEPAAGTTTELYLQWEPIKYSLAFDANGGDGQRTTATLGYDEVYSLPQAAPEFARFGYHQVGWALSSSAQSALYAGTGDQDISKVVNIDGATITLYAIWEGNTREVTFDPNTGMGGTAYASAQAGYTLRDGALVGQLKTGDAYTFPNDPTPAGSEYTFCGWYTKPEGGVRMTGYDTALMSGDTSVSYTYYAQYAKAAPFYAVRSDSDGNGTDDTLTFTSIKPEEGTYYTLNTASCGFASEADTATPTAPWSLDGFAANLKKVDFDVSFLMVQPQSLAGWFWNCEQLTDIAHVAYLDTSRCTSMLRTFQGARGLKSLDLSTFNTPCLTNVAFMCTHCVGLTTISLSGWDLSSVDNMRSTFNGCTNMESCSMSGVKAPAMNNLRGAFKGCAKLVTLDLSGFDLSGVTDATRCFAGCTRLATVLVSEGTNMSALTNYDGMFGTGTSGEGYTSAIVGRYFTKAGLFSSSPWATSNNFKDYARAQSATDNGYFTAVNRYNSYTVNYHYNAPDGTDAISKVRSIHSSLLGSYATIPEALWQYNGYKGVSWNAQADGSGVSYRLGASFASSTEPAIGETEDLYLQWDKIVYTVRFNANGGVGTIYSEKKYLYDDIVTMPTTENSGVTRDGYTLSGWSFGSTAPVAFALGATTNKLTTVDGDVVTMYAVWDKNSYPLAFDLNAGGGATWGQAGVTADPGNPDRYALATPLYFEGELAVAEPVREGYTFAGWKVSATDPTASGTATSVTKGADGTWTLRQGSVASTLTAQWTVEVPEAASLTFNGGEQKAVEAGVAYTLSNMVVNGPVVTDAGYGVREQGAAEAGSAFVTNAGSYAVTATLVDPATSTWADGTSAPRQVTVEVARLSMGNATLDVAGGSTYTGYAVEPAVCARYVDAASGLDLTMTEGVDYELSFANNVNAAPAMGSPAPSVTARAVAHGNYEDAAEPAQKTFEIAARSLDDAAVSLSAIADQTFTGDAHEPAFTVSLVTDAGTYRLGDNDYVAGWTNNINVGTAQATATAKVGGSGNFTGSAARDFGIVAASIEGAAVTLGEADAVYDFEGVDLAGSVAVASVSKDLNGDGVPEALAEGTHYTVQLADASKQPVTEVAKPGSYYVVLTGANNLGGTVYVPFEVQNKSYEVTFDANGGAFGVSTVPALTTQTYSLAHVLPSVPAREGFAFAGWHTARGTEGGSDWGTEVTASTIVGALGDGATYYAKWDRDAYVVKFEADHGVSVSGGSILDASGSVNVAYDNTVPTGITCDYDTSKYTFLGWTYTMARADGTLATGTVADYASVHVTGTATFTAKLVETTFVAATATDGLVGVGAPATAASSSVDSQATSEGLAVSFAPVNENYELDSVVVRDLAPSAGDAHTATVSAGSTSFTLGSNTYQYQWATSATDANAGSITIGSSTDPTMSLTFEVTYRAKETTYRVDVLRQDVVGDGYTKDEGASYTSGAVDAGSAIVIEPDPGVGFELGDVACASTSPVCEGVCVRADGTTVVTVRYVRQSCDYRVTYEDKATPPNALVDPVVGTARYGATVGIDEGCDVVVSAPAVAGYASRSAEPVTLGTDANSNVVKVTYTPQAYALTVDPGGSESWSQEGFAKATDGTFVTDKDHEVAYRGRLDITAPSRDGYEFAGWNVAGAGSSVTGSTFVQGTEAATLTATWTVVAPEAAALTYDGTQQVGVPASAGYTLAIEPDSSVSGNTASTDGMGVSDDGAYATHAGTYVVTVALADSVNSVTWSDGGTAVRTVAVRVARATNSWTTAPTVASVTYGDPVQPMGEPRFVADGQQVTWTYATEPAGTFASAEPTEAGVYYARASVAGTDDFADLVATTSFAITQRPITTDMVSTTASMEYTGGALTPGVTVRNGPATLVEGQDYTLSYADNTAAGTARAIVTGMGNYTGVAERTFEILPSSAMPPTAQSLVYNGHEQVAVRSGEGFALSIAPADEGVDGCGVYEYETNYGSAYVTHAGTYTVTATLDGNHVWRGKTGDAATAPIELVVTVAPFDLSVATVSGVVDKTYDAMEQTQRVRAQADLDGDLALDDLHEGQHYVVSYEHNVNAAPASSSTAPVVVLTGTGDCAGEVRTTFAIEPAKATIQVVPSDVRVISKVYDNNPATDPVYVTNVTGVCGTDDLAAAPARTNSSQDVGTYEVGATYTDSPNYDVAVLPSEMTIEPRPVAITVSDKSKTYGGADPAGSFSATAGSPYAVVAGDDLGLEYERLDTDENVLYSGSSVVAHAGALGARATNPNYDVEVTPGNLTIQPRTISGARVVLDGAWDAAANAYTYVLGEGGCAPYPTTVAVTLASGTENVSGSNYAIEYLNSSSVRVDQITAAGSYVVRLNGCGNYKDSVTAPARVTMATPMVTFNANGGSYGSGEATQSLQQTYGSAYRLPTTPTRPGYDFGGYFDNAECEGTPVIAAGSTATVGVSSDTVLYAGWNARSYTVDFVTGGTAATISGPTSVSVAYGDKVTSGPSGVTAAGVEFVGWRYAYVDVSGTTQSGMVSGVDGYQNVTVLGTADGSHIVMTAVFAGHTYMSGAATNGYVAMGYGANVARPEDATTSSAQEIHMDKDPERFPEGVVTTSFAFRPQNDNYDLASLAVTDQEGQEATLDATTQSFQLSGITYSVDLAFQDDGTATLYLSGVSGTAKSLSFVADYELVQTTYVVEHWKQVVNADGSLDYARANADVIDCEAGTTVSYELRSYEHLHFGSVSVLESTPDGEQPAEAPVARPAGTTIVRVKYDLDSFTAGWYDEDGATLIATGTAYYGYAPVFPDEHEPAKDADAQQTYTFAGWTDANGNRISGTDATQPLKATGDIKLSAVYEPAPREYSVSVDANGGSLDGDRMTKAAYGVAAAVSSSEPVPPSGASWTFDGWTAVKADAAATGEPGNVALGDDGTWTYSGGTCDVTLYARWSVAVPAGDGSAYTGNEVSVIGARPGYVATAVAAADAADAEGAVVRDGSALAVHAGTYRVTVRLEASDFANVSSVTWADGTSGSRVVDALVAKATNSWSGQPSIQSVVYGEPLAPSGQAAFQPESGPTFAYARAVDGPFVTARPAAVGDYYMRASVSESDDWLAITSEPVPFAIGAASLADYTLACPSATYTSLTQTPDCTLTRTGGTLTLVQGTDYAVSYFADAACAEPISSNALVDAGTYWVRADGLGNYAGSSSAPARYEILPAPLTVSGSDIAIAKRAYDGTTDCANALIDGTAATVAGAVAGQVPTLDFAQATGAYASKDAGTGIDVAIRGVRLADDAGAANVNRNYTIATSDDGVQAHATGTIEAAMLEVAGLSAPGRAYDATTTVAVSGTPQLVGAVAGETPSLVTSALTAEVADSGVGTAKPAVVSGLALDAANPVNANYAIAVCTVYADITRRPITVAGIGAQDKTYDGTTDATVDASSMSFGNVVGSESVALQTDKLVAVFDAAGAGDAVPVTVTGLALDETVPACANYELTTTSVASTARIQKAALTVTPVEKSFEYGAQHTLTEVTYAGFVNGETQAEASISGTPIVTCACSALSDVGDYDSSVDVSGLSAPNYRFVAAIGTVHVVQATVTWEPGAGVSPATPVFGQDYEPVGTPSFGTPTFAYATSADFAEGTVLAGKPTAAGTYWVRASVEGTANWYADESTASFQIAPASIEGATVQVSPVTFTGIAVEPEVNVALGDKSLAAGTDYTVAYFADEDCTKPVAEMVDAGSYWVRVSGAGNYAGSSVVSSLSVGPADISTGSVADIPSQQFVARALEPAVTVTWTGGDGVARTLVAGRDYTVEYSDNIQAGTANVTITGTGNFQTSSKLLAVFEILPTSVGLPTPVSGLVYNGGDQVGVSYDDGLCAAEHASATDAGEHVATVSLRDPLNSSWVGGGVGPVEVTYTIDRAPMSSVDVDTIGEGVATGKPVEPTVYASLAGHGLVEGRDYTVSYSGNVQPGTAYAHLDGVGNFQGSVSVPFRIVEAIRAIDVYRMYNPNSGEHFYTLSAGERDALVAAGWAYESVGWRAPSAGDPVHRLYNPYTGDHHYTPSSFERDALVGYGWRYEGVSWCSDAQRRVPLYRDYNPNARVGTHNYTTSAHEHQVLVSMGWVAEGVSWYGV